MIDEEREGAMEKPLLRENEVADGINVIIDERFVALFPMDCRAQVEHLINSVNLVVRQKFRERDDHGA